MTYDGINQYAYDAEGRVCAVYSGAAEDFTGYIYDGLGRRIAKGTLDPMKVTLPLTAAACDITKNGFVTTNVYVPGSSGEQLDEGDAGTNLHNSNIYANGQFLATVTSDNNLHFALNDWLGTKRVVTSASGTVEETCWSLPFGDELNCNGSDPSEQHFTGKERDSESGNDYFGARYYGSSMGRMLSPDPVGGSLANPQTLNKYAYVLNNPLTFTDPTGMIIDDAACMQDMKHCGNDWNKVQGIANQQDKNGNYLHPELHSELTTLQGDSRTFVIENSKLDAGTAGLFTITNFTADGKDFTRATLQLDFKQIKGISGVTGADLVPGFNKYQGLLDAPIDRLAETFGHEVGHGLFSIQNPGQAVNIQQLLNARDAAMQGAHYPYPPDVMQKMQQADQALIPTERYAQQVEKIVNGELQADKKKQ